MLDANPPGIHRCARQPQVWYAPVRPNAAAPLIGRATTPSAAHPEWRCAVQGVCLGGVCLLSAIRTLRISRRARRRIQRLHCRAISRGKDLVIVDEEKLDHIRSYDVKALEEFFARRPLNVIWRATQVTASLAVVGVGWLWDGATCDDHTRERNLAIRLREAFIGLGPTFVKLGQTLSCRPDLFSQEVLLEFERLQDNVPAFDHAVAMQMLKDELGLNDLRQLFRKIGDKPVAAASLGQVYRALLWSGEEVAVKLQRPGAAVTIALDLLAARWVATQLSERRSLLPEVLQDSDLVAVVDAFGTRLFEELDYEQEMQNAKRFLELYGSQPFLKVPEVHPDLVRRRVIVLEWINGVKLTDLKGMRSLGLDPLQLISINIECSMRQLLEHGYFHADPHPGNFIATPKGELCVLDFGMMCDMTKSTRLNLISHVVHFANRDYKAMAKDYKSLGFLDEDVDISPVAPQLEAYFEPRLRNASLGDVSFGTIVDGVGEVVFSNYKCNVPAFYALIVRSLVNLEGLALSVDPNYRMLASVYPYYARRILVDTDLRQSLLELLFEGAEADRGAKGDVKPAARFRWDRVTGLLDASDRASSTRTLASSQSRAWSGDSEIYQDFVGSLSEDPRFRNVAMQELAKAAELFLADMVDRQLGEEDRDEGRELRGSLLLEDTDQKALAEVRDVTTALADRFSRIFPNVEDAGRLAMEAAGRFASTGNAGLPSIPSLPSFSPEVIADFGARLQERVAVRALKTMSRMLDPDSDSKSSRTDSNELQVQQQNSKQK